MGLQELKLKTVFHEWVLNKPISPGFGLTTGKGKKIENVRDFIMAVISGDKQHIKLAHGILNCSRVLASLKCCFLLVYNPTMHI